MCMKNPRTIMNMIKTEQENKKSIGIILPLSHIPQLKTEDNEIREIYLGLGVNEINNYEQEQEVEVCNKIEYDSYDDVKFDNKYDYKYNEKELSLPYPISYNKNKYVKSSSNYKIGRCIKFNKWVVMINLSILIIILSFYYINLI